MRLTVQLFRSCGCLLIPALLLTFATGCATPSALKPEDVARAKQINIHAFLPQSGVQAGFKDTHYFASAGLSGLASDAVVNSIEKHKAGKKAKPLLQAISPAEFQTLCWNALSNAVPSNSWAKIVGLQTFNSTPRKPTPDELSDSILNLSFKYTLSSDCRTLILTTGFDFYPSRRSPRLAATRLGAYYSAEIGYQEGAEAISAWSTNNGALLRKAVAQGFQENLNLVRHAIDLMGAQTIAGARPGIVRGIVAGGIPTDWLPAGASILTGTVLEDAGGRVIFQTDEGVVLSLPRKQVAVQYTDGKS